MTPKNKKKIYVSIDDTKDHMGNVYNKLTGRRCNTPFQYDMIGIKTFTYTNQKHP